MTTAAETQAPETEATMEMVRALERRLDEVRGERDAAREMERRLLDASCEHAANEGRNERWARWWKEAAKSERRGRIEGEVMALRWSKASAEREEMRRERDRLREAAAGLLDFVRSRYPDDFKPGGRGFTCPHHLKLERALAAPRGDGR